MIGTRRAFLGGPWSSAEWPLRFAASLVAAAAARPCSCLDCYTAAMGCYSLISGSSKFILALAELDSLTKSITTAAHVHRMLNILCFCPLLGATAKPFINLKTTPLHSFGTVSVQHLLVFYTEQLVAKA